MFIWRPHVKMRMRSSILLLFLVYNGVLLTDINCPDKCVCRKISETSAGLKVKCGGTPLVKLSSVKDVDFTSIKLDIMHL